MMRFTYPGKNAAIVVRGINLNEALSVRIDDYDSGLKSISGWIKVDMENNEIIGYDPDRQPAQLIPELKNFKDALL